MMPNLSSSFRLPVASKWNRVVPYKPLVDRGIEIASVKPQRCIILQRPQAAASMIAGRDLDCRN